MAVTDKDGKVVFNADYHAFGSQYGKNVTDSSFDEWHGFNGKEFDQDTGLYYYNARWYDNETGRFISEDPVADPNNPNIYSYVANNPLRFTDPTGMDAKDDYFNAVSSGQITYQSLYTGPSLTDGSGGSGTPGSPTVTNPTPQLPSAGPTTNEDPTGGGTTKRKVDKAFDEIKVNYFSGEYLDPEKAKNLSHEKMLQIKEDYKLNNAQFLYLCEKVAHYNMEFKAGEKHGIGAYKKMDQNHPTWCNAYAGYTNYLFSGETDFFGKGLNPKKEGYFVDPGNYSSLVGTKDLADTLKNDGWKLVTSPEQAQELANKGIFAVGITPGHVAVVAPGKGYTNQDTGVFYPDVAQQGGYNEDKRRYSNYLYGVTVQGTMNYSFPSTGVDAYSNVIFYAKY